AEEDLGDAAEIRFLTSPLVRARRVARRTGRWGLIATHGLRGGSNGNRERSAHAAIDLPFLVDHLVRGLDRSRGLGLAEEEISLGLVERVGEEIEHRLLKIGLEVDEKVPA